MKKVVNKTGKKLIIISALILTLIACIAFIAAVEAVTVTNPDLDAAALSFSLFKKSPITGSAIDDSGNTIATVTIKANEEVGRVRDDFYGVNTHGAYLGAGTKIDADGDGTTEAYSDLEWHRKAFLDSGIKYMRWDARIDKYYKYNSSNSEYYFEGNLSEIIKQIKWAHENQIRILVITSYMPNWLADKSIEGCNINNLSRCPPSDYNIWGNITLDYLNRLTENGKYSEDIDIEVWNEPYGNSWLSDLSYDNIKKATEYIKLYNATYEAIKPKYPNINVGGPSGFREAPTMTSTFLKNLGNAIDFVSIHPYESGRDYGLKQYLDTKNVFSNCKEYNINCSRIIISEWNIGDTSLRNESFLKHQYANTLVQSYISILNNYPSITSMILYQWSESKKYASDTNYPEYPQRWSMVSEPQLDNAYYPSYNVTKDFAHYHAGGNMIVNSSSNNDSIKSVASLNPQGIWHITVINTATNNINVNIDVSSTGVEAIKDLSNDKTYPVSNGIANVGILTEYDVKHYEGIADYEPPVTITSNEEKSSSGGSSSSSSKLVSINDLTTSAHNEVVSIKPNTSLVVPTSEIITNLDTTSTSSKIQEEETIYGPSKANEEDIKLYQEGYESELEGNSYTGYLSLAVSNKNYLTIAIILLGSIICTAIIISIIYRKKKREADKVKKLMEWVDKARELGYTSEKMKEMLAKYNWDKELVEKVVGKE